MEKEINASRKKYVVANNYFNRDIPHSVVKSCSIQLNLINLFFYHTINLSIWVNLVGLPAVLSNFSISTCKRADISHLHHCSRKVRVECILIVRIRRHLQIGRPSTEQHLIRMKYPSLGCQIFVIVIVEDGWSNDVQG